MSGTLYLVSTPIGNLEDITFRAIRILKEVDIIAAEDTRQTLKLLNHFEIKNTLTSYFRHNEDKKGEYIVSQLLEGKNIALVSDAGTPAISDPGEELVRMAIESGVTIVPIPGAVAATSALIVSGLPTGRFVFEGFMPMHKKNRRERLMELKNEMRTMIFYEAPHKIKYTLKDMYEVWGDREVSLAREMTKIHEEVIRGKLSQIIEKFEKEPPRGEFVIIIDGSKEEKVLVDFWEKMNIIEHVDYYINQGMKNMDAMKKVATDRSMTKREIYDKYLNK